jgi:hypothetical protein
MTFGNDRLQVAVRDPAFAPFGVANEIKRRVLFAYLHYIRERCGKERFCTGDGRGPAGGRKHDYRLVQQ